MKRYRSECPGNHRRHSHQFTLLFKYFVLGHKYFNITHSDSNLKSCYKYVSAMHWKISSTGQGRRYLRKYNFKFSWTVYCGSFLAQYTVHTATFLRTYVLSTAHGYLRATYSTVHGNLHATFSTVHGNLRATFSIVHSNLHATLSTVQLQPSCHVLSLLGLRCFPLRIHNASRTWCTSLWMTDSYALSMTLQPIPCTKTSWWINNYIKILQIGKTSRYSDHPEFRQNTAPQNKSRHLQRFRVNPDNLQLQSKSRQLAMIHSKSLQPTTLLSKPETFCSTE